MHENYAQRFQSRILCELRKQFFFRPSRADRRKVWVLHSIGNIYRYHISAVVSFQRTTKMTTTMKMKREKTRTDSVVLCLI